jgi:putative ABC transport system permease protein
VGIYAVNAYSVGQRSNEIGLRMAVGASEGSVLAMILRQAMTPTCIGIVLGLSAGYLLAHASERLLFDVSSLDFGTYVTVPLLLAVVAAVAAYLPARHAVRTSPWSALREE